MAKPQPAPQNNALAAQQVTLAIHQVSAIQKRMNADLDAVIDHLRRLEGPVDYDSTERKNVSVDDWKKWLKKTKKRQ